MKTIANVRLYYTASYYLAWIPWSQSPMAKASFGPSYNDGTIPWFYTACIAVAPFTIKARKWCANAPPTGAAVISGTCPSITAYKGIVVCPTHLVATVTSLIED